MDYYKRRREGKEHDRSGHRVGAMQRKILLLLLGGFALGCSGSPRTSWKIIRGLQAEFKEINKQNAERAVAALYESKLLEAHKNKDGSFTMMLSDKGKKRALTYDLGKMKIKVPDAWDGEWRVVLFDVPEDERGARDALRDRLFNLGFHELQKSAWIHPFECRDEIEFLTELYNLRPYVRFLQARHIDNEAYIKQFFRLYS